MRPRARRARRRDRPFRHHRRVLLRARDRSTRDRFRHRVHPRSGVLGPGVPDCEQGEVEREAAGGGGGSGEDWVS